MFITKGIKNGKPYYLLTVIESEKDSNGKFIEKSRSTIFISDAIKDALVSCNVKVYERVFQEVK